MADAHRARHARRGDGVARRREHGGDAVTGVLEQVAPARVDDLAQLVDLDREDAAVLALVALVLDGAVEALVELDDAVAEEVLEPDHHRGLQAHAEGLVDHVEHPDAAAVGAGLDIHEPAVVH